MFVGALPQNRTQVEVVSKRAVSGNILAKNWESDLLDAIGDVLGTR